MKQDKQIDDHVSRLLKNHEARPALSSFDAIIAKLQKKKRRKLFWIFFTGLGLSGSICLLYFTGLSHAYTAPAKSVAIKETIADTEVKQPLEDLKTKGKDNHTLNQKQKTLAQKEERSNQKENNSRSTITGNTKIKSSPVHPIFSAESTGTAPGEPVNASSNSNSATKAEAENNLSFTADGIKDTVAEAVYLNPITPVFTPANNEIKPSAADILSFNLADSTKKEFKKPFHFYLGINFTPQACNYYAHDNREKSSGYNPALATEYRESKSDQAKFRLSYGYGLRFKVDYKNRWEFTAGLGIQKYNYREKPRSLTNYNNYNGYTTNFDASIPTDVNDEGYKNVLRYVSYSLEAAKIIQLKSLIKLKFGAGLQVNQRLWRGSHTLFISQPAESRYLNSIVCVPHLKAGVIYDLSKKMQLQLCPDIYYSVNSAFIKNYIIKQNMYGVGLEANLLFKLR